MQANAFTKKNKPSVKSSNQTISYLMKNLDLIKNINKFNRVSRKSQRRRSFSGIDHRRYSKNTSGAITPILSAKRKGDEVTFDMKSETKKNMRECKAESVNFNPTSNLNTSLYNEKMHNTVSGYYYDSEATKVPNFYMRPGPSSYQQN